MPVWMCGVATVVVTLQDVDVADLGVRVHRHRRVVGHDDLQLADPDLRPDPRRGRRRDVREVDPQVADAELVGRAGSAAAVAGW